MKKQLLITIFIKLSLFAGVVTDGSLGNSVNLTGPDYTIGQELGQLSGSNLFHSFDQFNLATGESAMFTGDTHITNIIGRITGGASFIDGEIGCSISGANLFLLNQAGMIFGQNASLNLTGAFHASTADYLQFSNQERFYSTPLMGSILSASSPESFGFLGNNGSITIDGTNLAVTADNNLSFSANGVKVTNSAQLTAEDGSINLSSIEHGTTTTESLSSNFLGADLAVDENSLIRTDGHGSGKIFIQGGEILINASTIENLNSGNSDDSLISLNSDKLNLTNSSYIKSVTTSEGNAANIDMNSNLITISGGSTISSKTNLSDSGTGGNSGTIFLEAHSIEIDSSSIKNSSLKGNGLTGGINCKSNSLIISNGSTIVNNKFGMGTGKNGSINLGVSGEFLISASQVGSETVIGMVEGGDININTSKLTLEKHASIYTTSRGMGSGGTTTISTNELNLLSGSLIEASALSRGDGGNIVLNISDKLTIGGTYSYNGVNYTSQILSRSTNSGDGGNIDINCGSLSLSDGGAISTASEATKRPGDAGNISISASDMTVVDSDITAESTGSTGGQIDIDVEEYLALINSSIKTKVHNGSGDAGNITINSQTMALNNSVVEANAFGGDGGNIFVDAQAIIMNSGSGFDASSVLGISGDISVTAPQVYINEEVEQLVTEFLAAEDWVDDKAKARLGKVNSFVIGSFMADELLDSEFFELKLDSRPRQRPKNNDKLKELLGF